MPGAPHPTAKAHWVHPPDHIQDPPLLIAESDVDRVAHPEGMDEGATAQILDPQRLPRLKRGPGQEATRSLACAPSPQHLRREEVSARLDNDCGHVE